MSPDMIDLLIKSFWETCYMVFASTALSALIGIPLGVILTVTRKDHILPNQPLNTVLGAIVNATRSTPFIILMVAIIPLTRMIVGSSIGTTAAIVPLTISAAPFIARIIESSLLEINPGIIEAAQAMGASPIGTASRSNAFHRLGRNACHHQLNRLLRNGRHLRRRRSGRPGNPLRLPALPDGCYDCHRCRAHRHGTGNAVLR